MSIKGSKITVNGIEYDTLIEPYELYKPKASYNTIRQRYYYRERYDWTGDEIFELKPRVRTNRPKQKKKLSKEQLERRESDTLIIDGVQYKSKNEAARAFDKEPTLVHNRLSSGMTLEEACKKPLAKVNPVVVKGEEFRSPMDAFDKLGKVSVSTYQSRRRTVKDRGLDVDKCVDFCIGLTHSPSEKA